jgi:hypothetical protein
MCRHFDVMGIFFLHSGIWGEIWVTKQGLTFICKSKEACEPASWISDLGAKIRGEVVGLISFDLSTTSSATSFLSFYLGSVIYGVETCYLDAVSHGAEKRVQI